MLKTSTLLTRNTARFAEYSWFAILTLLVSCVSSTTHDAKRSRERVPGQVVASGINPVLPRKEAPIDFGCDGVPETLHFTARAGVEVKSLTKGTVFKVKRPRPALASVLLVEPLVLLYLGDVVPIVSEGEMVHQGQSIAKVVRDSDVMVYGVFDCGIPNIVGGTQDSGRARDHSRLVPRCEDVLTQC